MRTRYFRVAWAIALIGLAILIACPLRSTLIRLAIVVDGMAVWLGLLLLVWRHKLLRLALIALSILPLVFISMPLHARTDQEQLRHIYIHRLKKYDGTRYVYGGENRLGIDCSGLVRAGMIEALGIHAIRTLNPAALRSSLHLWWRDSNAIDLGKGRTGDTLPIGDGSFVELSSHTDVLPGDMAVTESGSHVLVYLGDENWIEAEPAVGGTHIFSLSGRFAPLACERVRFVRWRWFANASNAP